MEKINKCECFPTINKDEKYTYSEVITCEYCYSRPFARDKNEEIIEKWKSGKANNN